MRGQLIVLDLLFALMIGITAIGVLSQASEFAQRAAFDEIASGDAHAVLIADFLVRNSSGSLDSSFTPRGTWCVQHVPRQLVDDCGNASMLALFGNASRVRVARRLASCNGTACLLEVKVKG